MAMEDVWSGGTPENETVYKTVDSPNREALGVIPFGSHVLLMNLVDGGVDMATGVWQEEDLASWRAQLPDDVTEFGNTTLYYIVPGDLKDADAPLVNVPTPDEIAEQVLAEFSEREFKTIQEMTVRAVELARKGFVQNPF